MISDSYCTRTAVSVHLGQVIYFGLIVRMGIDVYATHNIAGTLTTFGYTIGSGFATAATATISRAIGSGNESDVHISVGVTSSHPFR